MENRSSSAIFDTNDLKSFFRVARKNWWIFVGIVALSAGVAVYYGKTLPDVYSVVTEILLKSEDQDNSTLDALSNSQSSASSLLGSSQVQNYNEIQVLESFDLLRRVVDKMDIGVSYYIEGRLNDVEVFSGVPFKVNVLYINPALNETKIKIRFIDKYHYKIIYTKDKKEITQNGTFGDYLVNTDMKLQITNVRPNALVQELLNVNYYVHVHDLNGMVNNIQKNLLDIEVPEKTNVLQITLKDYNSRRGVAFLDTLIGLYVKNVVDHEIRVNDRTLDIVNKLLNNESEVLDTISLSIENYEVKKNILDLGKEEDEYFTQYGSLDANRTTLEAQVNSLNDLEKYIIEDKDPQFLPPSVYINSDDDFLKSATDELYSSQINRIDEQEKGTRQNITLTSLDNKIDSLKQKILDYISKDRTATNNLLKDNNAQLNQYVQQIKTLPDKQRGLTNISTQQDVNEQLYSFILQEKATTLIQ
ncbi:MAG TPA: Wzz/FepE/Etk N-terminal domain-containing protein, partial [Bacteroidia bacterium]|nr:Wzz/FepE/Etk N-terminal domain-containing protein [Bacteroidia bacterium]